MVKIVRLTETDLRDIIKKTINRIMLESNIQHCPKFLYHKSPYFVRDKILEQGLRPQIGASYKAHWEEAENLTPYIFLFDHETIENGEYDSTYDDDIWQIDTSLLDLNHLFPDPDENMLGCLAYDLPIPPQAMKLVYGGSEKDSWGVNTSHSYIY